MTEINLLAVPINRVSYNDSKEHGLDIRRLAVDLR
jgi:hypothetical protein